MSLDNIKFDVSTTCNDIRKALQDLESKTRLYNRLKEKAVSIQESNCNGPLCITICIVDEWVTTDGPTAISILENALRLVRSECEVQANNLGITIKEISE